MTLTPDAQSYEHRSCKHVVTWGSKPEVIVIDSGGLVAIRRPATALEIEVVPAYGLLCFAGRSA